MKKSVLQFDQYANEFDNLDSCKKCFPTNLLALSSERKRRRRKKMHITTSDFAIDLYHRHFDIRFEVLRIEKKYKKKRGTRFESEKGKSSSLKEIRTKEIGSFSANILPSQSSSEQPLQQT